MFYVLVPDLEMRDGLIAHLKEQGIMAVFHYVPLHTSPVGQRFGYRVGDLPVTEELSARLVRLAVLLRPGTDRASGDRVAHRAFSGGHNRPTSGRLSLGSARTANKSFKPGAVRWTR